MKLYALVEFTNGDEIEAIPSSWIVRGGKSCKWPPFKEKQANKITSLIKKCADPMADWPECGIKKIWKYYGK